jgi:DNA repair protein RecN (Recombination protein N)
MLSLIRVRNYTVIDEVELEPGSGFTVITGETGAGKSIIVDALGLALGDRADASAVRAGEERAEISVVFECSDDHPSSQWLRERSLDAEGTCVLRRIISAEGRSRAFINNQPVSAQDLRELGALLVDIHGQQAHQSLGSEATQRLILDSYGAHAALVDETAKGFVDWRAARRELESRRSGSAERSARLELLQFQASELQAVQPTDGEFETLTQERNRLANVDRLASGLAAVLTAVYEGDGACAQSLLAEAVRAMDQLAELDSELGEAAALLRDAEIAAGEAASLLRRYSDSLEHDPQRLDFVESRLARLRALARKHQVAEPELPKVLEALQGQLAELDGDEESLDALEKRAREAEARYLKQAHALSAAREAAALRLGESVTTQIRALGLPHGVFRVSVQRRNTERAEASGLDHIEFQVQLNPGQPFGALDRVASGGELSRVSLALEVVATHDSSVPTLVFDEVDAGIGGGVAEIVGARLADLARHRQVISVTHLPQVASYGREHFCVVKHTDGRTSRTEVKRLERAQRVEELSRMLGGVRITERARAHAEEMIERAGS